MSFPRYAAYKDSGVEWLGEVPEHWEVVKLGYFSKSHGGGTPPKDALHFWNGGIPWVSPKDMKAAKLRTTIDTLSQCALNSSPARMIDPDHVLLVFRSGILRKHIPVAINEVPVTTNQDIRAYDVRARLVPEFFLRLVQGLNRELRLEWSKQGATVESLESELVDSTRFPIPPLIEQRIIVDFLEHETAKIDALIQEQQRLIELLKEKRQAVISHAVTNGLDPSVPTKDSGVEWLGEVPEHWEILQLRRVTWAIKTGSTPSTESLSSDIADGVPWFTPGDFNTNLRLGNSAKSIADVTVSCGEARLFPAGTVLVVGIGATLGKVGYLSSPASANQQINAVIPSSKVRGYFLALALSVKTDEMLYLSNASTIGIMNQEKTKELWMAVPPLSEQQKVVDFLDAQSARTDRLISVAQQAVQLLMERRSALISAAVTGKIDVRNWQPPADECAFDEEVRQAGLEAAH